MQQPYGAPGYGAPQGMQQPYGAPQGYGTPGYGAPGGYRGGNGGVFDFNGWLNRAKLNPVNFAAPVAALLTLIFLFVKGFWLASQKNDWFKLEIKGSMFSNKVSYMGFSEKVKGGTGMLICAILVLIVLIWYILVEFHGGAQTGFGGAIAAYKRLPGSQFYAGALHIIFVVVGAIVIMNGLKKDIGEEGVDISLGLSFYMLLVAGILMLVPAIVRAVKHQPPYEV